MSSRTDIPNNLCMMGAYGIPGVPCVHAPSSQLLQHACHASSIFKCRHAFSIAGMLAMPAAFSSAGMHLQVQACISKCRHASSSAGMHLQVQACSPLQEASSPQSQCQRSGSVLSANTAAPAKAAGSGPGSPPASHGTVE
eukprot:1146520-Pelagomonas_calceolata.AAC.3